MKTIRVEVYEKGQMYRKGKMIIDGKVAMLTLERRDAGLRSDMTVEYIKEEKEIEICAIPYGVYKIEMLFSPKFKKVVPHIMSVPGFNNIEIHVLNTSLESEGCMGVGMTDRKHENWIGYSLTATRILKDLIDQMEDKDLWIQIVDMVS